MFKLRAPVIGGVFLALSLGGANLAVAEMATSKHAMLESSTAMHSEDSKLTLWLDARYEETLQASPMDLTALGRKERYNEIDDFSVNSFLDHLQWLERSVAELKGTIDYNKLSPAGQTSYDLWLYSYERMLKKKPFLVHDYVFHQMSGFQSSLPNFLINYHKVETPKDMRDYIERIAGVSRAVRQVLLRAQMAANDGIRPPAFAYDFAIEQAEKLISGAPFTDGDDAALMKDARSKIQSLLKADKINAAEASELMAQTEHVLKTDFKPTYDVLIAWLKQDSRKATQAPLGVSELPDGQAYYDYRLNLMTTTDMTADEIHQIGLQEVARIKAEMMAVKERVGFEGTLQKFFAFVRDDDQFYYPNTDEGREAYLNKTREFLDFVNAKLPDYFGILPKAPLEVRRVEAFREQDGAPQHYRAGSPDGSRPGVFYTHMSDMSANSTTDMETVAYHEANPGHHMQISIAQELKGIPKFRTQMRFTVYSEGWGLYAEKLALEMGAYQDPYNLMGHLTAEIWRAMRLVVDTGIHAKSWSLEQAVEYFLENSPIPETTTRAEIMRYFVLPAQATSYKIGMIKIQELREKARKELGDKFDIRGFHDTMLNGGAVPLSILEKRLNAWIETQR